MTDEVDLSFIDDGISEDELGQLAKVLGELEKIVGDTEIPADSEEARRAKEELMRLKQAISEQGITTAQIQAAMRDQRAANDRYKKTAPTDAEIKSAEEAVEKARAALADGSGTQEDLDNAIATLRDLKERKSKAEKSHTEDSSEIGGRVSSIAESSSPSGSPKSKESDSSTASPSSSSPSSSTNPLQSLASNNPLANIGQGVQQAATQAASVPSSLFPQNLGQDAGAGTPLSGSDVDKLLYGEGGDPEKSRDSTLSPVPAAGPTTNFRPSFNPAGAGLSSAQNPNPGSSVQGVSTDSNVTGRSGAPASPFAQNPVSTSPTSPSANPLGAGSARGMGGGMPMMPMMPHQGGAGAGKADEKKITPFKHETIEDIAINEAVPGGTIARSRDSQG